jgi:hypothetical protein
VEDEPDIRTATFDAVQRMEERGELVQCDSASGFDVPADFWDRARRVPCLSSNL